MSRNDSTQRLTIGDICGATSAQTYVRIYIYIYCCLSPAADNEHGSTIRALFTYSKRSHSLALFYDLLAPESFLYGLFFEKAVKRKGVGFPGLHSTLSVKRRVGGAVHQLDERSYAKPSCLTIVSRNEFPAPKRRTRTSETPTWCTCPAYQISGHSVSSLREQRH